MRKSVMTTRPRPGAVRSEEGRDNGCRRCIRLDVHGGRGG
jgi:hypothetical protein